MRRVTLAVLSLLFLLSSWYWVQWTSSYYFCIPLHIDNCWNSPLLQLEIGKKSYQVKLDLGTWPSAFCLEDLCKIDKRLCGRYWSVDIRGNKYDRPMYEVLGAEICGFPIPKMRVLEDSESFALNAVLAGDPGKVIYCGRIGREVFERKNFLLDFASSKMILCKRFKDLAKDGYNLKNFVKIPFEINRVGICFRAETDIGEQILLLDTGASHCLLRPPSKKNSLSPSSHWRTQKFTLGGFEFGPKDFFLFEASPLLDVIDGALGVDFLKQHAVYIDGKRLIAYIERTARPL